MVKVLSLFAVASVACGETINLTFKDCGSSSTHAKINSLTPSTIEMPGKATIIGTGALDSDQTSASFELKVKKGIIPFVSGKGSLCEDTTIKLPLGAGSFTVKGVDCPAKAGDVSVEVDLDILSSLVEEGENSLLSIHIGANADDTGDEVICLDVDASLASVASAACKGTADPAGPACYEGSAGALGLTETVKLNILEVSEGAGKLEFTGSGIEGFTCSDKTYTKSGSDVTLSDLSDCLPDHVEVTKTQYCSDDDTVKVTVKDDTVPLPVTATLKNVPCAGRDVFATCTGDADPVISDSVCYQGKAGALGLTETVTVKVNDFSNGGGHADFFGDGIESFTCTGKSFTKAGQDITFEDSSDCLPDKIVVSGVKYCSDSDTMKITVKHETVPSPISAIASKIDCPAALEV